MDYKQYKHPNPTNKWVRHVCYASAAVAGIMYFTLMGFEQELPKDKNYITMPQKERKRPYHIRTWRSLLKRTDGFWGVFENPDRKDPDLDSRVNSYDSKWQGL